MKTIFQLLLLLSLSITSSAQTGVLMDRYYISGSLSLGHGDRSFADNAAWLQLGKDTTKKGVLMPKVLLDSISTTKRALYVYDLKDSVLYHFDGSKRVRYMTYKDTTFIKQLIFTGLTTNKIPEGDTNKYYKDSRARAAISAGTGISYNNTTGVIANTGVTTVDGNTGAISLATTYHKQGGNAYAANAIIGNTANFGIDFITNNTTKLNITNGGKAILSGSTAEDVLTIGNDKTNKVVIGVGRNGGYASDNYPFISFGNVAINSLVPTIACVIAGIARMDFNKVDVLQLLSSTTGPTEIRGAVFDINEGTVLGIGSRANGVGTGHIGTSGSVNWLTIPWHNGVNSDIKPISGNMEFNVINIVPRINQTGTANGPVRGIYINPVVTSVPDFRAVHMANNVGYGIYQSSATAKNYFNGNVGIKITAPTEALEVGGNIKTSQPSVNGAGALKFGKVITGASVTIQTNKYLEIEVDGVIRKLAIAE